MEEIFVRAEKTGFESVDDMMDWLSKDKSGVVVRAKTVKMRNLAGNLTAPIRVGNQLTRATTLVEVQDLEDDVDDIVIETEVPKLIRLYKIRRIDRAENIFREVGASGRGLSNIMYALERNDYDLTRLKYHSFTVRGKERIGVWEKGRIGFLANITAYPKKIEEVEPPFETPEDIEKREME